MPGAKTKAHEVILRHDRDGFIRCRVCGCTEREPCCPPCSWAQADLCSNCHDTLMSLLIWTQSAHRANRSALWREIRFARGEA